MRKIVENPFALARGTFAVNALEVSLSWIKTGTFEVVLDEV